MEKAECLNDYFVSISTVDDSNVQLPPIQSRCENSLSTIHYALLVMLKHLLNF